MSRPFHEVADEYDDLIVSVEKLDVNERYDRVHVAARALLLDGAELHVSEVWIDGSPEKYSYDWLEETGETIVGWDDAPITNLSRRSRVTSTRKTAWRRRSR